MMQLFKTWVTDWGEGPETGVAISAHDHEDAAEKRAERSYQGNDHFDEVVISVRAVGLDVPDRSFKVQTDFSVQFDAYEVEGSGKPA